MKKVTAVTLAALMVCNVALAGNNMNTRPTMRERINRILQESGLHVFLEDKDTKNDVQMGNELQDKDLESQEVIEPIENEPEVVEEAKKGQRTIHYADQTGETKFRTSCQLKKRAF